MKQYLELLADIMKNGVDKQDRTGVGTRSVFGRSVRYDLSQGFPLLTTKKMFLKGIIHELLWFIKGETNIKYLRDNNVHIWDQWADEQGNLGPVYGKQWRNFGGGGFYDDDGCLVDGIDQLQELVFKLKYHPNDRRMIVSSWNPMELAEMKLPPCHMMFQCYVANGKLSLMMYQRSCDTFLGVPFNIATYSLLTMMLAQVCKLQPGEFIHVMGDTHVYHNHFDQVQEQLARQPYRLPKIKLNPDVGMLESFTIEDFELQDYKCHPTIKAPVAV